MKAVFEYFMKAEGFEPCLHGNNGMGDF